MQRQRFAVLLFCVLAALAMIWAAVEFVYATTALTAPVNYPESPQPPGKISADLRQQLHDAGKFELVRAIVYLQETADLDPQTLPASRAASRQAVVARLQATAAATQPPIRALLAKLQAEGVVAGYRPFWVVNGIAFTGTAEAIATIAAAPGVQIVREDGRFPLIPDDSRYQATRLQTTTTSVPQSWGIERVRTPHVWHGLGIDGDGVTVAIMDSGVDWLHPDLFPNYRGNNGAGQINHVGNWFHAATPTITEPIDLLGHGTHVAGTAVGQNGIGVAPGATWIAVSIADAEGLIYDSAVHAGFEWLLAPNGDPALAPDVVNNSWGGPPWRNVFWPDVEALHAAGIIPVFAAGNSGPFTETVLTPASFTDTLSVGASDRREEVTWFSGRGPSLFTSETKPWLVAPGETIYSAYPDDQYALANGTSMAAPHATGAVALLLSANPGLSASAVEQAFASTAAPLTDTHPNSDSGWGRLDAYTAVAPHTNTGALAGAITTDATPQAGVTVTTTTPSGYRLPFITDGKGDFHAPLRPGVYQITVAPFGFTPVTKTVSIQAGATTTQDLTLSRVPSGHFRGAVRDGDDSQPLLATLTIRPPDAPAFTIKTDENGRFTATLPSGEYQVTVSTLGYRLSHAPIIIKTGQTTTHNFLLAPGPRAMLIDASAWYYGSDVDYFRAGLDDVNLSYNDWPIYNPFADHPAQDEINSFDVVVWADPRFSPGFLGAGRTVSDYLSAGGNLLISGQNVGAFDSDVFFESWWYRGLQGHYLGKNVVTGAIQGASDTTFAGLSLTLNGDDSAHNQVAPDAAVPKRFALTEPAFFYNNGQPAGLQAGRCRTFRMVYLGFGLEGVDTAGNRAALLEESLNYFQTPPTTVGSQWREEPIDDYALPGHTLTYTLRLRNLSETMTDTFQLGVATDNWNASLLTPTLTLGPCAMAETMLTLHVPPETAKDTEHEAIVTAVSQNDPANQRTFSVRHKIPGHILLVDDDRWYNREAEFTAALDGMDLTYDVWEIGWDNNVRGSPSADLLQAYDIVIWYTAYDWFAPVTNVEEQALYDYLATGGRLFLTSQDYLYHHEHAPLTRDFLGVLDYRESITPTQVYGSDSILTAPLLAGPLPLQYKPYQNFSDGIIPQSQSTAALWHDQGMAAGVAQAGDTETGHPWRSVFWSMPWETLPLTARVPAMNETVGWLSDLGDSSFLVDTAVTLPGIARTFTLTLRNAGGGHTNQVTADNRLPEGLSIVPGSVTGGSYDGDRHAITWLGTLPSGDSHDISYRAFADTGLPAGTRLDNQVAIGYERHGLTFTRTVPLWVNAPDLSSSALSSVSVYDTKPVTDAHRVTYTLQLRNTGLAATAVSSTTLRYPDTLTPLTPTLHTTQGTVGWQPQRLSWEGVMQPGEVITVSAVFTQTVGVPGNWIGATAVIDDGTTRPHIRYNQRFLAPYRFHLPLLSYGTAPTFSSSRPRRLSPDSTRPALRVRKNITSRKTG